MSKNVLRIAAGLVLTAVLLYFFGHSVAWREVPAHIANVNVPLFLLAVLLSALHFVTRSIRWQVLVAREKLDVRFRNLVAANVVGFTVSAVFPGRLGELAKPIFLARREGLRRGFAIGTVVVERVFDALTNCFLLGLFLLARPLFASSWPLGKEAGESLVDWMRAGAALAAFLLTLTLLIYFFRERALRVAAFLLKPLPAKAAASAERAVRGFVEGLQFFRTPTQLGLYFALSLLVWLGITLFYWVFFLAYRVPVPFFMVWPYVFLTAVGASIPTPGMVGGFHYFSKLGMVLILGVAAGPAAGMTLVFHAVQIAVTCALGYGILAREGLTLFQLQRMGESDNR
ncbi:MAG: flippase-like domain-containing protein [Candidatus Aminicenantes bacterium]|nr:flippase-like domain-containing protein [Candidatus Aminicenantes bacterium]NLH76566.1 flippase-like domain-containing protein [Acidobacteriota bacterium]